MIKSKLFGYFYLLLGSAPMLYLIAFISFLYYTGNGFGETLTIYPLPEKKDTYLTWIEIILSLEYIWISAFIVWVFIVVINLFFVRDANAKPFVLISSLFFIGSIYISFFSRFGGEHGWMSDFFKLVSM